MDDVFPLSVAWRLSNLTGCSIDSDFYIVAQRADYFCLIKWKEKFKLLPQLLMCGVQDDLYLEIISWTRTDWPGDQKKFSSGVYAITDSCVALYKVKSQKNFNMTQIRIVNLPGSGKQIAAFID